MRTLAPAAARPPACPRLQVSTEHILLGLVAEDGGKGGFMGTGLTVRCRTPCAVQCMAPHACTCCMRAARARATAVRRPPPPAARPLFPLLHTLHVAQIEKARQEADALLGRGRREAPKDLPFR